MGREVGRIIFWSGMTNAVLAGLFVSTANWGRIESYVSGLLMSRETIATRVHDPLAGSRMHRRNLEQGAGGVQSSAKGSLGFTRIPVSGTYGEVQDGGTTEVSTADAESLDPVQDGVRSAEEVQGMKVTPILRKDRKTGQLEIGNFKPATLSGDAAECLDMGYSMLGDADVSSPNGPPARRR